MFTIEVVVVWYETDIDVFGFTVMAPDVRELQGLAHFVATFATTILADHSVTGVVVDDSEDDVLSTVYVFVDEGSIEDLWPYTRHVREIANQVLYDTVLNAE